MTATLAPNPPMNPPTPEERFEQIKNEVYRRLGGIPANHWRTDIKSLWNNRYRINIWTEVDRAQPKGFGMTELRIVPAHRITQSYFVEVRFTGSDTCEIVESNPTLEVEQKQLAA